ncbi:MAG: TerB family tellurite resistance protein [Pseudomonadota bacterium]
MTAPDAHAMEGRADAAPEGARGGFAGWLSRLFSSIGALFSFKHTPASKQVAFTIAFVGLAAKMAKADGVAVGVETEAFERTFYVPPEERRNVKRVYDLAAQDVAGFEAYAERIAILLADESRLLRDVFEALFTIAAADEVLHEAEETFLKTVADRFGMSDDEYAAVRRIFVKDTCTNHAILGLPCEATFDEVKARYRLLVKENHPDRLIADGVPREFLVMADRKMAAINGAFEAIERAQSSAEVLGHKGDDSSCGGDAS